MGMVFEAVNDGAGGRAAIKVLRPEVASRPDITARFFNEARAANSVSHPGIVRIFDCGYAPGGVAFLAMEFLEGESLRTRLERLGRLTVLDSLRISHQIASALRAAHQRLVAHRDLKPDNIMLVKDPDLPGGERIKVLDFGIAKMAEGASGHRTRSNVLMGTPLYMAPEQCHGAKLVTEKSDVYALGVILYQMLSGRPPFLGEGFGELAAMHLKEPPPALAELAPHVPLQIAAFVHVLLDKIETTRPTMDEVHRQLMRLMTKLSESPTSPPRLMSQSNDNISVSSDSAGQPIEPDQLGSMSQVASEEPGQSPQENEQINARETLPISVAALRQRLAAKASNIAPVPENSAPPSDKKPLPNDLQISPFTPIDHLEPLSVAPSTAPTAKRPALRPEDLLLAQQPAVQGNRTITGTASELKRPIRGGRLAVLASVTAIVGIGGGLWFSTHTVGERSAASLKTANRDGDPAPTQGPAEPRQTSGPIAVTSIITNSITDLGSQDDASANETDTATPIAEKPKKKLSTIDYLIKRSSDSYRRGDYEDSLKRASDCVRMDEDKFQCWWLVGMNSCVLAKVDSVTTAVDTLLSLKELEMADEIARECRTRWIYRGADQKFHLPSNIQNLPLKPFPSKP